MGEDWFAQAMGLPDDGHSNRNGHMDNTVFSRRSGPELDTVGACIDLLPDMQTRGIAAMAYSPIEQGALPDAPVIAQIAKRHSATVFQIALAWVLRQPGLIAIPKAGSLTHVAENAGAADLVLTPEDLAAIDAALPPPSRKSPLEML